MILIISSPRDAHAQAVAKSLTALARDDFHILDLGDMPMRMDLGIAMASGAAARFALRLADRRRIDLAEVTAVWWRRPQPYGLPPELSDPVHRAFAQQELDFALRGAWQCSRALWVNDVARDAAASNKVWQLDVANALGLRIPRTLITNSPEDAERFCDETSGSIVYKAFLASAMAWRETRILRPDDRALLAMVRVAPVIFQAYVPAIFDLRVTVVGDRIFAAAAETSKGEYTTDIRMNPGITWREYQLPDDVSERVPRLMETLGLEYGALDFRVTPDGEHVFLEINPAGQFLFIENATGMPIAAAMAAHLAAGVQGGRKGGLNTSAGSTPTEQSNPQAQAQHPMT